MDEELDELRSEITEIKQLLLNLTKSKDSSNVSHCKFNYQPNQYF